VLYYIPYTRATLKETTMFTTILGCLALLVFVAAALGAFDAEG
jgi:hypothetical protein